MTAVVVRFSRLVCSMLLELSRWDYGAGRSLAGDGAAAARSRACTDEEWCREDHKPYSSKLSCGSRVSSQCVHGPGPLPNAARYDDCGAHSIT